MSRWISSAAVTSRTLAASVLLVGAGPAFAGDCFNSPEDEYLYTSNESSPLRVTDDEMAALLARIRLDEARRLAAGKAGSTRVAQAPAPGGGAGADTD